MPARRVWFVASRASMAAADRRPPTKPNRNELRVCVRATAAARATATATATARPRQPQGHRGDELNRLVEQGLREVEMTFVVRIGCLNH